MKYFLLITILALHTFASSLGVYLENIFPIKGQIAIILYDKSKNEKYGVFLPVTKKNIVYKLDNVEKGTYYLTIFHDINSNHKEDYNEPTSNQKNFINIKSNKKFKDSLYINIWENISFDFKQ